MMMIDLCSIINKYPQGAKAPLRKTLPKLRATGTSRQGFQHSTDKRRIKPKAELLSGADDFVEGSTGANYLAFAKQ